MPEPITTEQVEKLEKTLSDVRERAERLEEQVKAGGGTAELKEQVDKTNKELDDLKAKYQEANDRLEKAETALNRPPMGGDTGSVEVKAEDLRAFRRMTKAETAGESEFVATKAALQEYMRKGRTADELKALSVESEPDGGYMVMPDTSGRIVQFVYDTSPMRRFAAAQTIGTDRLEGFFDIDEAASGWIGETASRTETSTPELGKYEIPVHELYANPRLTQKIIDDAMIDMEDWLAGKVQRRFARDEATAFVNGDGIVKPRGFNTYALGTPVSTSVDGFKKIQPTYTSSNGAFPATDPADVLSDCIHTMKQEYRAGAIWAMNRTTLGRVRTLKDADGNYILLPDFREGLTERVLGYQVAEFNDLGDYTTTDERAIYFANFGEGYQIVDRAGIRVLRDPYSAKPYVQLYTTKRVGGDVINFDALKAIVFGSA